MWEVPQHLTAGRAEGDRGEGGQTLAAVCLCGSVEEYVFGKSEHSHWGYPQICPLSPADSKLLGKPEVLFHWLTASVSSLLGTALGTLSQPSISWMMWIWLFHQFTFRSPQHAPVPSLVISSPFPALSLETDHTATAIFLSAETPAHCQSAKIFLLQAYQTQGGLFFRPQKPR